MTEAENRDQANLLLLCSFHSSVIDAETDAYPPETLQKWKAAAESGAGVGPITDQEVQRILEFSNHQEIVLSAETISLGGQLGGGGGAIGQGALGGSGNYFILGERDDELARMPETVGSPKIAREDETV